MNINNNLLLSSVPLPDYPVNASLGTAASTVDLACSFDINQTTVGVVLTLPTPTTATSSYVVVINNIGTTPIIIEGVTVVNSKTVIFVFNGTTWSGVTSGSVQTAGQVSYYDINGIPTGDANFTWDSTLSFLSLNSNQIAPGVGLDLLKLTNPASGNPAHSFYVTSNGFVAIGMAPGGVSDKVIITGKVRIFSGNFQMDSGKAAFGHTTSPVAYVDIAAGTTADAQLKLRPGVAPSVPTDGDVWFDGTDIKIRVSGVTKTFTLV